MPKKIIAILAIMLVVGVSSVAYFIYAGQNDEAKLKKYDMYNVNLDATVETVKKLKGLEFFEEKARGLEYDVTLKGKFFDRKANFIYMFDYDGINAKNLSQISIGFQDDKYLEDYEKSIEAFNDIKSTFNEVYGKPATETSGNVEDNSKYVWHDIEWVSRGVKIILTSDLKSDNSAKQVVIVTFESL